MKFGDAVRTCLSKYFTAAGRAPRSEYWWFYMLVIAVAFLTGFSDSQLLALAYYALVIPTITAGVRRMHDTGRSGWFLLIPFANLYWLVQPSDPAANGYGEPPTS